MNATTEDAPKGYIEGVYGSLSLFFISLFTVLVPRRLFPPAAFITGLLFYLFTAERRRGIRANLRAVTGRGDVELLVISTYYKFARNWCDIMLMMRLRGERLERLILPRSDGRPLDEALAKGNGAIIITPHLGNWELGGLGLAGRGYRINVMTFREPDEKVNAMREQARLERGIGTIYVDRDFTSPLAVIEAVNALRRNEVVALLGDRDGSSHTESLRFFGRESSIPVGAAYLALASGAPVIPVFLPLEEGRYATYMEEGIYLSGGHGEHAAVIRAGTERVLRLFEKYIRRYPDQWYNLFDYWQHQSQKPKDA